MIKPSPEFGHARYKAHKSMIRKRETWMPGRADSIRLDGLNRHLLVQRARALNQKRKP